MMPTLERAPSLLTHSPRRRERAKEGTAARGEGRVEQNVSSSLWVRGCLHWAQERHCLPRKFHLECQPGGLAVSAEEGRSPREALLVTLIWAICSRAMWLLIKPTRVREGGMLHSEGDDLGPGFECRAPAQERIWSWCL